MASSGSSSTSSGPVATGSRRRRLVLRLSQKDALQALFQQNPYPGIATRERLARELGIAESRVQVWFQNQRRRRFKQSRSPPEHVHQEGEAGPTSTPAPPSRPPRPQSSSPGNLASALPIASPPGGPRTLLLPESSLCRSGATPPVRVGGQHWVPFLGTPSPAPSGTSGSGCPGNLGRGVPQGTRRQGRRRKDTHRDTHARIHDGCRHPAHLWLYSFEPCPGCRATCGDPGAEDAFAENGPAGAALGLTDQRPGGQAGCRMGRRAGAGTVIWTVWFQNRRARHPQQSPSGPGGAAATTPPAPEDRRTPPAVQSTSPPLRPSPPQESMPPSAAPAAPFGAPAFWVPGTAPGVCVGQPLMIFMVQPSPGALWPSGKPPPPAQVAGPWAVSSPYRHGLGQPGQGPSCRLHSRRHTSRAGRGHPTVKARPLR
nr:double homeobox protein 4-like protein 4 [Ovis aries]